MYSLDDKNNVIVIKIELQLNRIVGVTCEDTIIELLSF